MVGESEEKKEKTSQVRKLASSFCGDSFEFLSSSDNNGLILRDLTGAAQHWGSFLASLLWYLLRNPLVLVSWPPSFGIV